MLESLEVARGAALRRHLLEEIPKLLAAWPTHFVFGNCDTTSDEQRAAIEQAGLTCHGLFGDIELAGRRIALLHSHDARLFRHVCTSGEYDLVCYGHTHHAEQHRVGKTLDSQSRSALSGHATFDRRRGTGPDGGDYCAGVVIYRLAVESIIKLKNWWPW